MILNSMSSRCKKNIQYVKRACLSKIVHMICLNFLSHMCTCMYVHIYTTSVVLSPYIPRYINIQLSHQTIHDLRVDLSEVLEEVRGHRLECLVRPL